MRRGMGLCLYVLRWMLVAACVSEGVAGAVPQQEGAALCALLHSTRGDSWRWRPEILAGAVWNCSVDAAGGLVHNPCSHGGSSWQGVTCSGTPAECSSQVCQVTELVLPLFNMTGPIPPEIGNLTSLEIFDVGSNSLTGSIPVCVGELTALQVLYLFNNMLTGPIPVELGQLTALEILYLYSNMLTGHIPVELGQLTQLEHIYLSFNKLSGSIPVEMGQLTALERLQFNDNQLTGSIPVEVGQLIALVRLHLYGNFLKGYIPLEIGQLKNLQQLYLDSNHLSGSIPSTVGQLTAMKYLNLYDNQLVGTIPVEVGKLINLRYLVVYSNQLTGHIPVEVGLLTALELLSLYDNQLSGSIPVELGHLNVLELFAVRTNQLTGTVPVEVGQLTVLELLYINDNYLTGPIPAELGQLTFLKVFYLHDNKLTGSIPLELGQLTALERLAIHNNHLTGPILPGVVNGLGNVDELFLYDNELVGPLPIEMTNMRKLKTLFLQDNLLTGTLEGVFNSSTQIHLTTIDFSDNRLMGSLPVEMFLLSHLQVLSLSVNCFEDALSESICSATQAEVLSMNGLRAAEGCEDRAVFPLSGVALFNTIGGTIPHCVWLLKNLTVLHLVGNGLSGSLINTIPMYSQLEDLSLSRNQLTGTIPTDFFEVIHLDLSFNQFAGEYLDRTLSSLSSGINFEINRLSGQLPLSGIEEMSNSSLKILRGNMFSCNSIPDNDAYSSDYVCGSLHLNYSFISFASAVGICVAMLTVMLILNCDDTFGAKGGSKWQYLVALLWPCENSIHNVDLSVYNEVYSHFLHKIAMLNGIFGKVMRLAVHLLVVVMAGSMPLYVLKALDTGGQYSTHSHTYSWFWTLAFMRGEVPAVLLIILWASAVVACFFRILVFEARRGSSTENTEGCHNYTGVGVRCSDTSYRNRSIYIIVAFVLNAGIAVTVNALYIYSTQQALSASIHFSLQLSLSIFRILYTVFALPLLSKSISSTIMNVRFRFFLLTINNLLIPCVVTALTSDACIQGLIVPADAVRTPYSYRTCLVMTTNVDRGEAVCTEYGIQEVESAPLVPPFTYNNQCGSVLLTSYIPVILLGYSLQLLLSWILLALEVQLPYNYIPSFIRVSLHGLLWPDHWLQDGDALNQNQATVDRVPDVLLKVRTVLCNDVLNNWLVFMTFGFCSPILAIAIVCCVVLKMSLWVLLVGRFTKRVLQDSHECIVAPAGPTQEQQLATSASSDENNEIENKKNSLCFALSSLAQVYVPLYTVLAQSFWSLTCCSALFVALLTWDMASDEVGWLRSLWVPLLPITIVTILYLVDYYYLISSTHVDTEKQIAVEDKIDPSLDEKRCSDVTQSPFHVEEGCGL